MTGLAAMVAGLLLSGGLWAVVGGFRRRERRTAARTPLSSRWRRWTRRPPGRAGRRRDLVLVGSIAGGLVLAATTGWVIALAVVPGLALGLPYLLMVPASRDVVLLEAMDRWVRALASTLTTGRSITDAIRLSRRTAPPAIADDVTALVVRLNNRWDTRDALLHFADALDSPDADAVIAALMLAARRGANGASVTLHALADSIQAQLRGRRLIEIERAKPYVVVRQVTVISLITLAGVFAAQPAFFAPYRTPVGQAILAVLVLAYLGSLVLMRRKARSQARDRILVRPA